MPYSTSFQRTINSVSAEEYPLILLEITRDDLATPIRVVNDRTDLVHSNNTFQAMGFRISLPDNPETGMPYASISLDNVGRELTDWVENCDWSQPTYTKIIQVMRSNPNVAEWSVTMEMTDVSMTSMEVTAKLGFEDLLGSPGVNVKYTPHNSIGLF